MNTGQVVAELGLYYTDCCSAELIFGLGDAFCECPECRQRCGWELECVLVTTQELDNLDKIAAA